MSVGFTQAAYVADEVTPPGVPRRLEVRLNGAASSTGPVSVTVRASGGTATLGADFSFAADAAADPTDHLVVEWAAGDVDSAFVEYRVVDDTLAETGEEVRFELVDPHGVEIDAAGAKTRTWIYDDDYPGAAKLRKASGHDMEYYISFPAPPPPGVSSADDEPPYVVFAIDGAGGWYRGMDEAYRTARGDRPIVLVTPITRSNGAPWPALAEYYPTNITDDAARFAFDEAGVLAIWSDLRAAGVTADDRFDVTGYSGGGLLAYRLIFHHPELLVAAALACPNFWASAVERVSSSPARRSLPVTVFQGLDDPYLRDSLERQWLSAQRMLADNGYANVSRRMLPGGHDAFAPDVLSFFTEHHSGRGDQGSRCFLPLATR